jgi:hypothetical protein
MYTCVSEGYTERMALRTKDAGLRLRVERELRDEFVEVCRAQGQPAAQVLRDFMRQHVAKTRSVAQQDLFPTIPLGTER